VIVVIGHERLYSDLSQKYTDDSMTILKLTKSGGAVSRSKEYARKLQLQSIKHYFYGSPDFELMPFSQTVSFADVAVRRIGEGALAPTSALPM
jgi:polyribonucleotide 5'-hydroxyl-kinase